MLSHTIELKKKKKLKKVFKMAQSIFKRLVILCFFTTALSCKSQNCNNIDLQNKNYKEAIQEIKQANFNLTEKVNTNSSWIKSIEYYSCDEITGFLIMITKKETQYIHRAVPVNLWYKFKSANSFGRFYTSNIKGKYQY